MLAMTAGKGKFFVLYIIYATLLLEINDAGLEFWSQDSNQ